MNCSSFVKTKSNITLDTFIYYFYYLYLLGDGLLTPEELDYFANGK